jgi:hypothetical protein
MSKVTIAGDVNGTGVFTIAAPNGNTNRTLTLPDEAGTLVTTAGVPSSAMPAGSVLQVVNFQTGTYASGTTAIPHDNTIPQNTEGTEFMSLAITPTSASSKLKIDVSIRGALSGSNYFIAALFQDTTASALAASMTDIFSANYPTFVAFTYYMTSGTTSATTFKVRAGGDSVATLSFNGAGGSQRFGGVSSSSITITEIQV